MSLSENKAPKEVTELVSAQLRRGPPRRYGRRITVFHEGVTYRFRAERIWLVRQVEPPIELPPETYVYFKP